MILVASQRGGAKQLGLHLLKTEENEHVEVHEIRGFVSADVVGALKEAQSVSQGTRCKQFLFSVSLNPPESERVEIGAFEAALDRIEERCGLTGQPRVVVFHEKEGRRHCHAVWSRIDIETMTAKNLPFFKTKLRDISRELYLEHDWQMPRGHMNSQESDPRNFTLAEWQQAKRVGLHARDLKGMFQECWAASDSRRAFESALAERGFKLAKGDKRGYVAVSHTGETLSIARQIGKKARELEARLGDPQDVRSVDEAKAEYARELTPVVRSYLNEADQSARAEMSPYLAKRRTMAQAHRQARSRLDGQQRERSEAETQERAGRIRKGLFGLWDRVIGKRARLLRQNECETEQSRERDRQERQALVNAKLGERQHLQISIQRMRSKHVRLKTEIHRELYRLQKAGIDPPAKSPTQEDNRAATPSLRDQFKEHRRKQAQERERRTRDNPRPRRKRGGPSLEM